MNKTIWMILISGICVICGALWFKEHPYQSEKLPQPFIQTERHTQVVVIGAGISGLKAASELKKNGKDVVVLESSDHIGGRLRSESIAPGITLDIGASWVHEIDGNAVYDLVKQSGVKSTITDYENTLTYTRSGSISAEDEERKNAIFAEFLEYIDAHSDDSAGDHPLDVLMGDFSREKKLTTQEQGWFLHSLQTEIVSDYGTEAKNISTRGILSEPSNQSDDAFVLGYTGILPTLASGLDILTGSTVTQVIYTDSGVTVGYGSGKTITGDAVVVTVPLGVLKKGSIQFLPSLPVEKQNAIESLKMGNLTKTFLLFDRVFWDKNVDTFGYTDGPNGSWSFWLNVYRYTGLPILLGLNGGEYSRELEKKTDSEIQEEAMKVLRSIYGPDTTSPKGILVSRWSLDPHTYGSYSYLPLGAAPDTFDILAKPVGKRLFFAGEATNKKYHSSVRGAYDSGVRVAKEVENILFNQD